MKKLLTLTALLIIISLLSKASTIKKTIQVNIPSKLKSITFFYRDSTFSDASIRIVNTQNQNAIINKDIYMLPANILRYSFGYLKDGRPNVIHQYFIIPETTDTIKFELDTNNYKLQIKSGVKFFIQDVLDLFHNDPIMTSLKNKEFLDDNIGRRIIDSIYEQNRANVNLLINKRLCTKKEYDILLIMAKTDYYYRLITWAKKNNRFDDIKNEMENLNRDRNELQSISHTGLTDVFSSFFGYIIYKDQLNPEEAKNILTSLINLGWNKAITAEFILYSISNQKIEPNDAPKIYEDLKTYLNGTYEDKLVKMSIMLLPKITDTERILLLTTNGQKITFKQLMERNANKFLIIDFWASWCKPCREQAPYFEKNKQFFTKENIVFISLSLDEDNKIVEWKKALNDDNLFSSSNQYKLITPNVSPLFKNFKISEIPRYALINSKGEFVDSDFLMPSDIDFIDKLLRLIRKN